MFWDLEVWEELHAIVDGMSGRLVVLGLAEWNGEENETSTEFKYGGIPNFMQTFRSKKFLNWICGFTGSQCKRFE